MTRTALVILVLLAGCSPGIYVRDGVTDGDTFHLAPVALTDDDPALQSWVTYSLVRSTCQLGIGGENPARASSFECELTARARLLDAWQRQRSEHPGASDAYLDDLELVEEAGWLDEYVVRYFGDDHWQLPVNADQQAFRRWQRRHLPGHSPETRIVGSWSYSGR